MRKLAITLTVLLVVMGSRMVIADDGDLEDYPWDGLSPETALLIGDTAPVFDAQGELTVKWFLRDVVDLEFDFIPPFIDPQFNEGESTDNIEPPNLPKAEKDFEWVLIWSEFTCLQETCTPLEDMTFYLAGDMTAPYENVVDVDGKPLDGLLAGALSEGESAVGWIVFEVDYYEYGEQALVFWDMGEEPHYFLIADFPPDVIVVTVTARGTTPLYECPSEDCAQIERAASGESFLLLDSEDDWFLVRSVFGKIGYLSIRQANTP